MVRDAGYAFAGARFDAVVAAGSGGLADSASGFLRPFPLAHIVPQAIVASRFGAVLKLDDSRDTLPPGDGTRGVSPSQGKEIMGDPRFFTTANPISVFEFTLELDGSTGTRSLSEFFLPPSRRGCTCPNAGHLHHARWTYQPPPHHAPRPHHKRHPRSGRPRPCSARPAGAPTPGAHHFRAARAHSGIDHSPMSAGLFAIATSHGGARPGREAVREGFEPPRPLRAYPISSRMVSAAHPSHRAREL